ncbi:hypothetical protein HO173_010630 [Letharia columbiana]|uniref:Uncharacterized protein n=1 Tax=Letharia columbiana TaxID=112416 RepID=A0A8H6FM86_9LECA|nr:uncharacterized protein HO173_010630 [Letharia columbiana]KAF6231130.1 hypothetical protein HO173_010630 [Letharia columbiana]
MLTSDVIAQGRIFWLMDPYKDQDSDDLDNPESTHDKKSNLQRYIKPGQFTTLVSAAFTCDATTTLKIFTELVDAHKVTRLAFTETKQEKSPGVSDTVGES